jgi:hypothetical protein
MALFTVVFTVIGPQALLEVVKVPIELPSAYNVTSVLASVVPLSVPETEVALSVMFAGRAPQRERLVTLAVANVDELGLRLQVPFCAVA